MKEEAKNSKFGLLREIRYENYKVEVNESSHSNFVVIILHQDYVENSNILCEILKNLAKKHPQVKFLKFRLQIVFLILKILMFQLYLYIKMVKYSNNFYLLLIFSVVIK